MVAKSTTSKKEAAIRADEDKKIARAARLRGAAANHGSGFMNFVREQGVVGLAVGLAIGTAAGASVKVIVDELISPLVALMTRGVDLNSMKWVIMPAENGMKEVAIGYGAILSSLITLLATAFVIYQLVHIAKLDRMDKKKDD